MICEKGKLTCLEKELEMKNRGISCEEFAIKGGILGFAENNFLEKKARGAKDPWSFC